MPQPEYIESKSLGNVTLLSCDHRPERITIDPWGGIDDQIKKSSLVFVEYFPPELEKTVYRHRLVGRWARRDGEITGINSFFNRVASLAAHYRKDVAVADIANKPLFEVYHFGSMLALLIPCIAAFAYEGIRLVPLPLYAAGGFLGMHILNTTIICERMNPLEKFILDMTDARRVLTARALTQTAQEQPASNLLYIGPHAHVNRIGNYLEYPESLSYRVKSRVYSLLPGLDKETRVYRYDTEDDSWRKV